MSEPMPFAKIRLSLMFAAEHELPIELGTDEVWSVLNKLDQLSAETGKAIARAEAAEAELAALKERTQWVPVSERLPKYINRTITLKKSQIYDGFVIGAEYWMYRPEPPESENE